MDGVTFYFHGEHIKLIQERQKHLKGKEYHFPEATGVVLTHEGEGIQTLAR